MGKLVVGILVFLVVAGAGYWAAASGTFGQNIDPLRLFPYEKRVSSCERVLSERLRAPSTYHRVDVSEIHNGDPLATVDDLVKDGLRGAALDNIRDWMKGSSRDSAKPAVYEYLIHYDAANGFGAPVRGIAACTYVSLFGQQAPTSDLLDNVFVDGITSLDWTLESVKAQAAS